jgi:hypothetical protein
MSFWKQTTALTTTGLRGITQRSGAALVTVIGVTTVVGVLVSLLSMGEGAQIFTGKSARSDEVVVPGAPGRRLGGGGGAPPPRLHRASCPARPCSPCRTLPV